MRKRPLLLASVGFTFGVLYGPADLPWLDLILGLLCFAIARRRKFRFPVMQSAFVATGAFLLGLPIGSLFLPSAETLGPGRATIEGTIVEAPDRGLLADGIIVDVTSPETARVMLRVPHGARPDHPRPCGDAGDRIRATVDLTPRRASLVPAFRSRRLAVRRGVQLYGEVIGSCETIDPGFDGGFISRAIGDAIRRAEPSHAGILGALATGDRTGAELAVEAEIADSGYSFLFELSGLAMALPFFLLLFALRDRMRARWLALPFLITLVFCFGATPSIIRTAIVLTCLLLPALGKLDVLDALALSVIVVLAISPAGLGDVRFQLAFAGLSAALRLYPAIAVRIPGLANLPKPARAPLHLLLLSIAIVIGTGPLAARLFDRVSLVSFAFAPIVLILIALISLVALAGGLLALITPALGTPFLWIGSNLLDAMLALLPGPIAAIPTPTVLECVLVYGLITTFAAPSSAEPRAKRAKIALATTSAAALVGLSLLGIMRRSSFEAAILPTTAGQAWVVRTPDGSVMVRDTSPAAAWFQTERRLVGNYLKLRRETEIDVLFTEDDTVASELGHQFPIGRIEPMQPHLRIDTPAGSILFAHTSSAAADVVVLPDGTVTAGDRTYQLAKTGLIRIREQDGRLIALPLRPMP